MTAFLVALLSSFLILGPGVLAPAEAGCLERVAERRTANGWGLEGVSPGDFDVLVALEDCATIGAEGVLIAGGQVYTALVVDCENAEHAGQMAERGLLADVSRGDLGKYGAIILWAK
jgi:hypothetical protein